MIAKISRKTLGKRELIVGDIAPTLARTIVRAKSYSTFLDDKISWQYVVINIKSFVTLWNSECCDNLNVDISSVQASEMKPNGMYRLIRNDSFDLFEFNDRPAYRKDNTNLFLRYNRWTGKQTGHGQWEVYDFDLGISRIYFEDPFGQILCPESIGSNWTTLDDHGKMTTHSHMTIDCG